MLSFYVTNFIIVVVVVDWVMEAPSAANQLRFAVVCSSNQNRSMEAHNIMQ